MLTHIRGCNTKMLWVFFLFTSISIIHQAYGAETPKTLVVAQAGDVATIDNQQSVGPAKNALIQIYDWQWMRFRPVATPDGTLITRRKGPEDILPAIIQAWETEELPDGTAIHRFHIRPGGVHHSGNPITAEDFKYSWMRRAGLGRDYLHRFLGGMYHIKKGKDKMTLEESIKIIDEYTFEIRVKKNMPFFFDLWLQRVYFDSKLVKARATKEDPWAKKYVAKNDCGNGPYVIEKWEVGNEMILKRFEKYWGPRPPIDRIIFKTVPDLSSRVLLLKNGDIDVALNIPLRELMSLKKDPKIRVISAPSSNQLFIYMHQDIEPFNNKDLRLALSYAFPYDIIIPTIYGGAAQPSYGPIPTGFQGALTERRYKTDLELARKHFKQAGLGDKLTLTLKWMTGFPQYKQIGILFQENLKKIGITLKLQQLPRGQFQTGLRSKNMDFFIDDALGWIKTPEYVHVMNFSSQSNVNYTKYKNDRVDELIVAAMAESDPVKRSKMTSEAQELILNDVPRIFIAQPSFQLAMRKNIVGYVAQNTELHHFWLVDKK